jgi:hypothetical protein
VLHITINFHFSPSKSSLVVLKSRELTNMSLSLLLSRKNVRFTTPIQQLYNNPSHEDESHILGPTLM